MEVVEGERERERGNGGMSKDGFCLLCKKRERREKWGEVTTKPVSASASASAATSCWRLVVVGFVSR